MDDLNEPDLHDVVRAQLHGAKEAIVRARDDVGLTQSAQDALVHLHAAVTALAQIVESK